MVPDQRNAAEPGQQLGEVGINGGNGLDYAMPFGGYKQSGWGRENGREGIEAYTEVKSVSVAL